MTSRYSSRTPTNESKQKDDSEGSQSPNNEDVEKQHDHKDQGEPPSPPDSASFKDRIAHFTWPWFASTMSTGALAVVIGNTPNRFDGLQTIGKIFFIVDLVMFVLWNIAMGLRAFWFPRRFLSSFHHPVEGLFFGAYWVSVSLILTGSQTYGVPNAGPWLPKALLVLFWMYCAIVLLVAIGQYFVLFQRERLKITDAVPAWIFPIYPLLVVGSMAGTMIPSQSQTNAFDMWVGAVMLQGLAWTVALMMYSMYTQRLMTSALPSPPSRPGMYVSVGPAGYTAAALISLGKQAPSVLPADTFNTNNLSDGNFVKILGILSGTFIIIFAFWFFCISTVSVVAGIREMSFTLNWWAFIFPNAGLTLAAIQLGSAYSSPAINGICSALTILLVIMWLFTAASHARAWYQGKIMWPGKDEDKDMPYGWGKYSA